MSDNPNEPGKFEKFFSNRSSFLPPLVEKITDTGVEWKGLKDIDFTLVGYFLTCHLVIEHYIDHFLSRASYKPFAWEKARLQFSQKLALISKFRCFAPPYDFIPGILHLNKLRNQLAHDISKVITAEDVQPLREWLARYPSQAPDDERVLPEQPHQILALFTGYVCSWFAGAISGTD